MIRNARNATPLAAAGAIAATLFTATASADMESLLAYVPSQAEVVIYVDGDKITDSHLMTLIRQGKAGFEMPEKEIEAIKALTGVDIYESIHDIVLAAVVDDDKAFLIAVDGDLEQDRLTALLKFNETYEVIEEGGLTVHHWDDDGGNYATFVDADTLLFAKSADVLKQAMTAKGKKSQSFLSSETYKGFGGEQKEEAAAWISITKPGGDLEHVWYSLQLDAMLMELYLEDEECTLTSTSTLKSEESAELWAEMARGFASFVQLQRFAPEFQELAEDLDIGEAEGQSVETSLTLPTERALELFQVLADNAK
ncbi:MAG: hypothetical protein RLY93_02455 [Sumerlaeia bacterium]